MELVYLWVEDYKNIHEQGFNFSPKFSCHYDVDSNELTIDKNDDYIDNFFGDNINITAIVGKNGSGKSAILEVIESIYSDNISPINFIFCIENDVEKKCFTTIDINYKGGFCIEKLEPTLPIIGNLNPNPFNFNFNFLTYSAEIPFPKGNDKKSYFYKNNMAVSLDEKDIYDIAANYLDSDFKVSSFMFLPEKIYIIQDENQLNRLLEDIKPEIMVRSNNPENGVPYEESHYERENFGTDNILEAYYVYMFVVHGYSYDLFEENSFEHPKHGYNTSVLETLFNNEKYKFNEEGYSLDEFNKLLEKRIFENSTLLEEDKNLIYKYKRFLKFDFEDKRGRKYSSLSHGEKTIYGQLLNIYNKCNVLKDNSILILLDEPDLALHPEWQKKYINELYSSVGLLNKQLHFVMTSHSPFLLSDIPKQNIIFLDKDENGKCKVVDGLNEKKQTFGANIHTLLSDSFFMEDGLMGEFAKEKINEIINYLNGNNTNIKSDEEAQKLINIIGEPIVKNQLQRILDSKRLSKVDEIDELKSTMAKMQKRIDELEQ